VQRDASSLMLMAGPDRVILWADSINFDSRVLYLSPGALTLMQALVTGLPEPLEVTATDLPFERAMTLGDASDWETTGPSAYHT
jgi:hypothetical protein